MKKLVFSLCLLLVFACSKDDNETTNNSSNNENIVYTGSTNPLLLTKKVNSNERVEVYGVRDNNGLPAEITHLVLRNSIDEETVYGIDDSGKLGYVKAYDGTVAKLEWNGNLIDVTVIGANKESFFKTTVDLSNSLDRRASYIHSSKKNSSDSKISLGKNAKGDHVNYQILNRNESANNIMQVNVSRCGQLSDYEGVVYVQRLIAGQPKFSSYLSRTGTGVYSGYVKSPAGAPITPGPLCSALEPLLGDFCEGLDPPGSIVDPTLIGEAVCVSIGFYISLTGAVPVGVGFTALCTALNTFFGLACTFNDFCDSAEFQNISLTGQEFDFRAVLSGPDGNFEGPWTRVDFREPLPTLEVNLGDTYEHLVQISAPNLDCQSDWQAFVNSNNLGSISSDFPVFTVLPNGEHTIYLSDGITFTENWDDPITLPCEAIDGPLPEFGSPVRNYSFDVDCEETDPEIDFTGGWTFVPSQVIGPSYSYSCLTGELLNLIPDGSSAFLGTIVVNDNGSIEDSTYNGYYTVTGSLSETGASIEALRDLGNTYDFMTFSGSWNPETQSFNGTASRTFRQWCTESRNQLSAETIASGSISLE